MAEQNEQQRTLSDFAKPAIMGTQSSIVRPPITAMNFELKPSFIQMLQQSAQFNGLADEDPNSHIENFLEVCDMLKINGVTDDAIRLRAFPFSLKGKARHWLHSLPRASITTWEETAEAFLARYFPPGKSARLRNEISSFVQMELESLFETWDRFKELLRKCQQHGFPEWMIIQTFYNGLNPSTKQLLDAAAGGTLGNKTPVDAVTSLAVQVESLSRKLNALASPRVAAITTCNGCGGGHASSDCPTAIGGTSAVEQADFVGNAYRGQGKGNPYSGTYNPGWKNHPNFSWSNQGQSQQKNNAPPGFQGQQAPNLESRVTGLEGKMTDLERALTRFVSSSDARFQSVEATLRNHTASLHNLEN
ncbi:S-adenosyl-L-methionine-dependent methyltransferase protein [Dioscorea alata]|uniref:S-adenosyl-L-methionine-dependent methyltransferase protein n=1 Tax=Dioscorea alata TaxID=55571 RepID=A0ACB7V5Y5_DIOAL|nr:S-adenosyl-L-methionine-dependent methyltransferase protein [Dioscorea alata]